MATIFSGATARGRRDGKEVVYSSPSGFCSVSVLASGDELAFGSPRQLFAFDESIAECSSDTGRDATRFLCVQRLDAATETRFSVALNAY